MIRALLVDDEAPARERLRGLLAAREDVEIVGEAVDGEEALERVAELKPDVLFLDIQMPGCSGIDVAASLPEPRPRIVFCTAYDSYAVDAFELHATDYLLKPVSRARLAKALQRLDGPTVADDGAGAGTGRYPERFLAKRGVRVCVVPEREVLYFTSEQGQTRLQTADQHYWMQPTLSDLEARLDPARWHRISRAALIHLDRVVEVVPDPGGQGDARMADGKELAVSRRRFKRLLELLEGR